MEIYVYGVGCAAGELLDTMRLPQDVRAFVESAPRTAEFLGRPVITPEALAARDYELVLVASRHAEEIAARCAAAGIDAEKLFFLKNSVILSDRNRCYEAAERALGAELMGELRERCRVIGTLPESGESPLAARDYENDYVRVKTLELLCGRLRGVPGAAAELGVFRGGFARCLNALCPERTLYLFDTFTGFSGEEEARAGAGFAGAHRETGIGRVRALLPHPEKAVFRPGSFPETAAGLEDERFALVSLDVDFEESSLAGLRFFVPRLSPGGALLLHDYNSPALPGVKAALARYEQESGRRLPAVPLCDRNGTLVILGRMD